jgi:hypothetical protein
LKKCSSITPVEGGSVKRPRVSRAQSAAFFGPVVLPVLTVLTLFSAADVRGFALPEASVEGLGVGSGSSLIEPSAVVVQVGSVAAALVVMPMYICHGPADACGR